MRIAWIGPAPSDRGGVAYMAKQMLAALPGAGADVEAFLPVAREELPADLKDVESLTFCLIPSGWRYGAWYSRTDTTKFISGLAEQLRSRVRLGRAVARRHAEQPFDVLYQFGNLELAALRMFQRRLPPIIVHPEVHAAGELRWLRRERHLVHDGWMSPRQMLTPAVMATRALAQRGDSRLLRGIIAPGASFAEELASDLHLDPGAIRVVPNMIDLERFRPSPHNDSSSKQTILFVSRIAVRKGVEMVVDLSHRLDDRAGEIQIEVIGAQSLWSDYRRLLRNLNPRVARWSGEEVPAEQVVEALQTADLLVQPSHYEPFALTVGEALACGVPVVTSDAVGASEQVDGLACRRFAGGDGGAFEVSVRDMLDRMKGPQRTSVIDKARSEAVRLFAPETVARGVLEALEHLLAAPRVASRESSR
jgi:glycosyltransferase involved in cell wall biosynthesis